MPPSRTESDWRNHREMSDELRAICVETIGASVDLPTEAKEHREAICSVQITTFDQSYIDFLDGQIALKPRGQEWNDILKHRRDALSNHIGRELASCRIKAGIHDYWIRIDPVERSVVHWEVYNETK